MGEKKEPAYNMACTSNRCESRNSIKALKDVFVISKDEIKLTGRGKIKLRRVHDFGNKQKIFSV